MNSDVIEYRGYISRLHVDISNKIVYGKIEGIRDNVSFESESISEIETAFKDAVDDYIDFCNSIEKNPEKPFKGNFNVRISPELHRDLYLEASKKSISINKAVEIAVNDWVHRGTHKEFENVLNNALANVKKFSMEISNMQPALNYTIDFSPVRYSTQHVA